MSDTVAGQVPGGPLAVAGLALVPLGDADAGACVDGVCVLPAREAAGPAR